MTFPIPDATLANHIAVLGKTGSGKTSTSKLIVEHEVEQGFRVCILDPIKSDWWGITSSAGGKTAGWVDYPFGGALALTDAGKVVAPAPDLSQSFHDSLRGILTGPQRLVLDYLLIEAEGASREKICAALGWEATSGHIKNVVGSMKTLELLEYPKPGEVRLQQWVIG